MGNRCAHISRKSRWVILTFAPKAWRRDLGVLTLVGCVVCYLFCPAGMVPGEIPGHLFFLEVHETPAGLSSLRAGISSMELVCWMNRGSADLQISALFPCFQRQGWVSSHGMAATAPDVAEVPADPTTPPKADHPTKGRRFRVLDGEDGDVCLVRCVTQGDKNFPPGTLLPIEGVPRFETATRALRWVRFDSGDLLQGMQVMIFVAKEILNINVENTPKVTITAKVKRQISGPVAV